MPNFSSHLQHSIFKAVSQQATAMHLETYVIGGYVRDLILNRPSKDIDFVTIGSGIELAQQTALSINPRIKVNVFKNFGTAQFVFQNTEVEFVGARKESYQRDSRKPIVEDGTLEDDQNRRDFTINAMALSMNKGSFGELVDPFDGLGDLERKIIRTPLDPDITFDDDPLRMMRAIRFATQLRFIIETETLEAISRNKERIEIISRERVADELNKIILGETIDWL
jgi:poly(A) polymerase